VLDGITSSAASRPFTAVDRDAAWAGRAGRGPRRAAWRRDLAPPWRWPRRPRAAPVAATWG